MFHKRLMKEFRNNRKYVAGMVLTQWISLLANVAFTFVIAIFLEELLAGGYEPGHFLILAGVCAAVFLIRSAMTVQNTKMSHLASMRVKETLREQIYVKLMQLGTSYRDRAATSEAVQISTEGVDQLEIYFGKYVPQFFYSLLAPLTLFLIVGNISMKVALVLLLCVPLIPLSIVAVQKFAKRLLAKYWGTYTGLGDSFLENLQGLNTLKIYQADARYAKKMDEEAEAFRKVTMRVLIMQLNSISVMDLAAYGGAAAGIILSVLELKSGNVTFAESIFMILVSAEFFLPLRLLGSFFHIAMNGNAAADKIFALLDAPVPKKGTIRETEGAAIGFEHVSFGYVEEKDVLRDISFEMPEGRFLALVGTSGCGKSTVASLLMGEHSEAVRGKITIGGIPVSEISEDTLRKKIVRVRHDSYLFTGTVLSNLKMGNPDASIHEMEEALKQVDLYDTVMEKGGLSMPVTEKAGNLSGGQRQRLALARAILRDGEIYIFDEATSNVDAESEEKIMKAIRRLAEKKTVILISHRLMNVVEADRILVLRDGHLDEEGTHETLLSADGWYRELFLAQAKLERFASEPQDKRPENAEERKKNGEPLIREGENRKKRQKKVVGMDAETKGKGRKACG